jgi:hypothetical protein
MDMATARKTRMLVAGLALPTLGLAALGLAGGTAEAAPVPSYHWCPGGQWDPGWGSIYDWDWNRCHDWQRAAGQGGPMGQGPWGVPPSWAPPPPPAPPWAPGADIMWNQTARAWGLWNNGIWMTI